MLNVFPVAGAIQDSGDTAKKNKTSAPSFLPSSEEADSKQGNK